MESPGYPPLLEEFSKQPYEEYAIGVEFSAVVDTDEESVLLSSSSVTCVDASGEEDTSVYISGSFDVQTDTILRVRIKDGAESNSPYKFTFKCVTSEGNKWEKDIQMNVRDI